MTVSIQHVLRVRMCLIQRRFLDTGVVAVRFARAVSMSTQTTAASVEFVGHAESDRGRDCAFKHIYLQPIYSNPNDLAEGQE